MKVTTNNEQETKDIAKEIHTKYPKGALIYLYGDLGTGKTIFTKGFASAIGIKEKIKSPTYTLLKHYKKGDTSLFHFDLYRITEADEYIIHEIETAKQTKNAYIIIEWPERLKNYNLNPTTKIEIKHKTKTQRTLKIT